MLGLRCSPRWAAIRSRGGRELGGAGVVGRVAAGGFVTPIGGPDRGLDGQPQREDDERGDGDPPAEVAGPGCEGEHPPRVAWGTLL